MYVELQSTIIQIEGTNILCRPLCPSLLLCLSAKHETGDDDVPKILLVDTRVKTNDVETEPKQRETEDV